LIIWAEYSENQGVSAWEGASAKPLVLAVFFNINSFLMKIMHQKIKKICSYNFDGNKTLNFYKYRD